MPSLQPNVLFVAVAALLLAACAADQKNAVINHTKLQPINKEFEGAFCSGGTKSDLGGIATTPNVAQLTIGKCKHPSWRKEDVIVLYFGDATQQASPGFFNEEIDSFLHPENYLSQAEIAEMECIDGSDCKLNKELLRKGLVVHFATDAAIPQDVNEISNIERLARTAKEQHVVLVVTGHTDNTASEKHNNPLSLNRAAAIRKILIDLGIASKNIVVTGRSSVAPVATNDTAEGRAANRRAEIKYSTNQE